MEGKPPGLGGWEGRFLTTERERALLQHLLVMCKDTEATMGLGDRLFVQGFMVMLTEGYRRLVLAAGVFEAVILLIEAEFTIMWLFSR